MISSVVLKLEDELSSSKEEAVSWRRSNEQLGREMEQVREELETTQRELEVVSQHSSGPKSPDNPHGVCLSSAIVENTSGGSDTSGARSQSPSSLSHGANTGFYIPPSEGDEPHHCHCSNKEAVRVQEEQNAFLGQRVESLTTRLSESQQVIEQQHLSLLQLQLLVEESSNRRSQDAATSLESGENSLAAEPEIAAFFEKAETLRSAIPSEEDVVDRRARLLFATFRLRFLRSEAAVCGVLALFALVLSVASSIPPF